MIEFWLICVGILFVLAEFCLWVKQFILPLPIYIIAGAFLAIASNYEGGIMSLFRQNNNSSPEVISQTATTIENTQTINSDNIQYQSLPSASIADRDEELADK